MAFKPRYIILLILAASSFLVKAQVQDDMLRFSNMSAQLGQLHVSINDIHEDTYGFLWFGTNVGLYRYDGYEFKAFQHDVYDSLSLSSAQVWKVTEDLDGNILAATTYGISILDLKTETFERLLLNSKEPSTKSINKIRSILVDKQGQIWVGGNVGLLRYDPIKDVFIKIRELNNSGSNRLIRTFFESEDGTIWAGMDRGMLKILPGDTTCEYVELNSTIGGEQTRINVNDIKGWDERNMLLATSSGLYLFNTDDLFISQLPLWMEFNDVHVRSVLRSADNSLWLSFFNSGLGHLNSNTAAMRHFLHDGQSFNSIHTNDVRCLLEDQFGNIWVGTVSGITRIAAKPLAGYLIRNVNGDNQLINHVMRIHVDSNEALWMKTPSGLIRKSPNEQTFSFVDILPNVDEYNLGDWIHQDATGGIWIPVDKYGLLYKKAESDLFEVLPLSDDLKNSHIYKLLADNKNNDIIWIGTTLGICKLNTSTLEETWFKPREYFTELPSNRLSIFEQFQDEIILYYTGFNALGSLSKNEGELRIIRPPKEQEYVLEGVIRDIAISSDGNVWIAGLYGLTRYDLNSDKFHLYGKRNGLYDNVLNAVIVDQKDRIWVSGQQLYAEFIPESEEFEIYSNTEIQSFWSKSKFLDNDGRIYFGGFNGAYTFHPDSLNKTPLPPLVILTDFKIKDSSYRFELPIEQTSSITLPFDQNDIAFSFSGIQYTSPEEIQYRCILEGYDNEWRQLGTTRDVNYTNLNHGNYTFRVEASNGDGVWSQGGLEVSLLINPPFTQTGLFRALIIILIGVFLYFIYKIWNHQHQLKQQKDIAEKASEYRMRFLSHVSHEIRTPMNAIAGLSGLIQETTLDESQSKMVSAIKKSSVNLLDIINELLDLSKLESDMFSFSNEPFSLRSITEQIRSLFNTLAIEANLSLTISIDDNVEDNLVGDGLRLIQVLTNLMGNAIKYTHEGGIDVLITDTPQDDNTVAVSFRIKDTGVGISREKIEHVFDRFSDTSKELWSKSSGLGLYITRELVERQGGSIKIESELTKGTTVEVIMPYLIGEPVTLNKDKAAIDYQLENLNILVVDDAPFNHLVVGEMLRKRIPGVIITSVSDGLDAIESVKNETFDLIIMDARMPGMNGYQATQNIRKMGNGVSSIPILGATASAMPGEIEACLNAGMDDVVTKPIHIDELVRKIFNLVKVNKT